MKVLKKSTINDVIITSFYCVKIGTTVNECINYIRNNIKDISVNYIYIVDQFNILKGIITFRLLMISNPTQYVDEVMIKNSIKLCSIYDDKENIIINMKKFNLYVLPVIDFNKKIIGIIKYKNLINSLKHLKDETIYDSILYSLKKRSPWLVVNLFTVFISSSVISFYQSYISSITVLAVLMPIVASLGGNSGSQTLVISIRSITTGDINNCNIYKVCINECCKGALNGLLIGFLASFLAYFISKNLALTLVILISIILTMAIGSTAGFLIPTFLRKLKLDPAQSSSIFLTGVTDTLGFFIFLTLSTYFFI